MVLTDITTKLENYVSKGLEAKNLKFEEIKKNHLTYKSPDAFDKKAEETYWNTITTLFDEIKGIPEELNNVRKLIESALIKPIPENLNTLIEHFLKMQSVGDLREKDIDLLMLNSEHNYAGRRIVESRFNQPKYVENMYSEAIDSLDYIEDSLNRFIIEPYNKHETPNLDNYHVRVFLHKEKTDEYVKAINDFIDRFVDEN